MKQTVMLIISTTVLIIAGIWELNYLDDSSMYILSDIDYSKNAINNNNFKLAQEHIKSIEDTWDSMSNVWSIFIDHSEINSIEDALSMYSSYIEQNDKEQSLVYANELDKAFRNVVKNERVNLYNIF